MPRARNVKDRCEQVLAWLVETNPCGRRVEIRWVTWTSKENKGCYGETSRDGNVLIIKMNRRKNRTYAEAIDTVIHEFSHCALWGMAQVEAKEDIEHHDSSFWSKYGHLHNSFHLLDGDIESARYEF